MSMNRAAQKMIEKKFFYIILFLIAVTLSLLAPRAAVNVDEVLHHTHAKNVVNWYFTCGADTTCLHTPVTNLVYYSQSADNLTALIIRIFDIKDEYLVRQYAGAVFFLLLLFMSGLMAKSVSRSWTVSIVVILALFFMPRLTGQALGNLKDIPFAAGYMGGLLAILQFSKELPRPQWKTTIALALAIAFTVSVRAGGFILFAYLAMAVLFFLLVRPNPLQYLISLKPQMAGLIAKGMLILIVGYFAGLVFWPFALQDVLHHPLQGLAMMENYKVSIRQLFLGQLLWSTELPWFYLPLWLLISTPLFTLAGFALFLLLIPATYKRNPLQPPHYFGEALLIVSVIFPVIYVISIQSNLYSGIRQMLFILPPMAILAAMGVRTAYTLLAAKQNKIYASSFMGLFIILLIWPAKHQIQTFPVDYVYFNALAGGSKKAWGNFEYDYYFHALKKPAAFLVDLVHKKKTTEPVMVAINSNLFNYFEPHPDIAVQYTRYMERSSIDWDYGLFGVNYIHPHLLQNKLWQSEDIIKTWYHKGNPVAVLIERKDKSDFLGISEIKNVHLQEGIALLEYAIQRNPNNVWIYVYLARARFNSGDTSGSLQTIKRGKQIHPYYEPLLLLEAETLYKTGNITEARTVMYKLLSINPRYQPAEKLYLDMKYP